MRQSFFVQGPLPSMNEIINASSTVLKGGIRFGSKYTVMKKKCQEIIVAAIKEHKIKEIKGEYKCDFVWVEKNRRKDPDNIASGVKFVFDALVDSGVVENDTWRYNKGWTNTFIIGDTPGVKVSITKCK